MSRSSRRFPSPLAPLALALVLHMGCSSSSTSSGSVQLAASVPQALSASDVTRVKVTVSASDMSSLAVELAKSNGSWGGLIGNIPAGSNRSFLAEAFDSSGAKRFQGTASGVAITANQTTAVALTLQELVPPLPYGNEAPVIDSAVASSTSVQTGASLSLTATVHDPNPGDTLTYAWTASGGTFSAPTAASPSWTAPSSPGVQTLTFTVTDSQGAAVSVSLTVNVVSGAATGNAAINVSFNLWPVVSKVSASLNRLDAGQSTTVSALASDADGDALSYQWTASCPGSWTNASSSSASFVPSSVPAGACNNCQLSVSVLDSRGGQTSGSLHLCIAAASTLRFPPSFTNFYQSSTSASPAQTVTFDVTAMDSQASSLTFAWNANTGSLATAQSTATTSRIVWTAPSCTPSGATVTATVTNAYGLSASQPFTLSGLPECPVNQWASGGTLITGRHFHTATLLPSGKVLVTGGLRSTGALSSVEVYDPATNTWSAAASMASMREWHTATLLSSGKVLVTGGKDEAGNWHSSAELYNPATNSWSSAGSMVLIRVSHTATLLPSGKVLVVGGGSSPGDALNSTEVYDPDTNTWSQAGTMATRRANHTATLLSSGKVLVAGGATLSARTATTEVYDPATNSWSSAGVLAAGRYYHAAALLSSGKVLVMGGYQVPPIAELYDPATNSWSSGGSMVQGRFHNKAILLPSGKVLVTGGEPLNAELYDPGTNSWSAAASMAQGRTASTATLLPSGKVLVSGGYMGVFHTLSSAELYSP